MDVENPRREIEEAVAAGDLTTLLKTSGMLHGHFCPFLAAGVKAGALAMRELRARSTGMEDLLAIVETNNCFSDGVQMTTGCTFGNNALIFRDCGKTAFSLVARDGEGLRVRVRAERVMQERSPEATALFEKVVVKRAGGAEEGRRLSALWRELSFRVIGLPDEEVLDVARVSVEVPPYARIFASATCSVCGESVMETRARFKDGKPVCLDCSGQEYGRLAGDGISIGRRVS
ncbi:MAG: TraR/DksA C4-type zinc finger protein [Spirochaetales bacterium]|nr:TraR/DksA C4-type zinc finger protein [Spirochaetales bacterium]